MSDTPNQDGGIGGLPVVSEMRDSQDVALLSRAIREGWPIKPEHRKLVVDTMAGLVETCGDPRIKTAASRVLVTADKVNVAKMNVAATQAGPPQSVTVNVSTGPTQVSIFGQIDAYDAEFRAASARKIVDASEDQVTSEDRALAGLPIKSAAVPHTESIDPPN
jgi:hypothetical protein